MTTARTSSATAWRVFEQETRPVREHYLELGTPIVTIDGARDRAEVEADVVAAVRGLEQS